MVFIFDNFKQYYLIKRRNTMNKKIRKMDNNKIKSGDKTYIKVIGETPALKQQGDSI
jgi:hypothetical protein